MSSSVVSPTASSALPYYHTLYSKPPGAKKVHATTFVPEVGVFKGPSIKHMGKGTAPPHSSVGSSASSNTSSSWHSSSDFPLRAEPRPLSVAVSPRLSDGTPSPSLLSPGREAGTLLTSPSHHRMPSPGVSPSVSHISVETPLNIETGSSIDSASVRSHSVPSVRSQSVASAQSGIELNDSDDTSGNEENALVIDDDDDDSVDERNSSNTNTRHGKIFQIEPSSPRDSAQVKERLAGSDCFLPRLEIPATVSGPVSLADKACLSPKMRHKKLAASVYSHVDTNDNSMSSNSCGKGHPVPSSAEGSGAIPSARKLGPHASQLPRMRHTGTCADLKKTLPDSKTLASRRAVPPIRGDPRLVKGAVSDTEVSRCISAPPSGAEPPCHVIHKAVVAPSHSGAGKEDKQDSSVEHTGGK